MTSHCPDNPDSPRSCCSKGLLYTVVALATLLVMFVLIRFTNERATPVPLDAGRSAQRTAAAQEQAAANEQYLNGYAWEKKDNGVVRLSIDRAVRIAQPRLEKDPAAFRQELIERSKKASAPPVNNFE